MPWTETTRLEYRRDELRYSSDTTEAEWAVLSGYLPGSRRLGRPRTTALRAVVDAIFYMLSSGCTWRQLPRDFPPRSTVQGYFYRWRDDRVWPAINHYLLMREREATGRVVRQAHHEGKPIGRCDRQSVGEDDGGRRAARL